MSYPPPDIPNLPCPSINTQLQERLSQPADNILKSILSHYICSLFSSILSLYHILLRSTVIEKWSIPRRRYIAWVLACVLVPLVIIIVLFLTYRFAVSYIYLLDVIMRYALAGLAWVALGVGASGVWFFNKDEEEVEKKE